ncbi:U3 small nucleolar ribonucleoprotein LCP5 [Yarrowia sp. C11]|nr:U3 small nucleolar ribonucleoprotein LCP5 [Yarrowia sp. C11]
MEALLKEITTATENSATKLKDEQQAYNALDDDVKAQIQRDSLSLLGLKNHTMLAYLHHLAVVTLAQVQRVEKEQKDDSLEKGRQAAIQGTVKNRVVLEKGIKGLESKVNYQIDKMLKAYTQDKERKAEREKQRAEKALLGADKEDDDEDEDDKEDGDDDESESEDDNLAFKPNVSNLTREKNARPVRDARAKKSEKEDDRESASNTIYRPPKISAVAPESKSMRNSKKKNATMEEYLKYSSSAPMVEQSIGSGILEHGRGGEKTDRDRKREEEVQRYEEDNFVRLPGANKKERSKLKKARAGAFFGEDWGVGGDIGEATKRKRGGSSMWEKSKRRR